MNKAKKAKIFIEAALVIAVTLALITPVSAFITNSENNQPFNDAKLIENPPLQTIKINNQNNLLNTGNTRISFDSEGDFLKPGITRDGEGNIVVSYTEYLSFSDVRLAWSYSQDNGQTWESIYWTEPVIDFYNDIAWEDNPLYTGLLGVYYQLEDQYESFYLIPDITDLESWLFYYWTEPEPDIQYMCISDYGFLEGQYHDMDGPVYHVIKYLDYSPYNIPQCPNQFIIGFDENGEVAGGESTFDGQAGPHGTSEFLTAPAYDPDMSNEHMKSHHTWQYYNEETEKFQIVWKMCIAIDGDTDSTDIEFTPYAEYLGEGEHPAIAHNGDNVAVVFMNEGNVICAYSSNDGETWDTTTIGSGTYPDICFAENKFKCAYVNGGNLYIVTSADGGATWDDPTQINDVDGSVVEEENAIDIHAAGVVWIDDREGSNNIYFASGGASPILEITEISGGLGVSALITNSGTADATNVDWSITLDGTVFLGAETTDTISSIAVGESVPIKSGFPLGFGPIDITITAQSAEGPSDTETASGKLLLFFITGL